MADREFPANPEDLYDYNGVVPLSRPIIQGDIFRAVTAPGLGQDADALIMVLQHPCSMRRGVQLEEKITVGQVVSYQDIKSNSQWQGHANVMPLPALDVGSGIYAADFRKVATVDSRLLIRGNRVATLSTFGIGVLQQRQAYYLTRFTVDVDKLVETFEHVSEEMELQEEWVEQGLQSEKTEAASRILELEEEFQRLLDADGRHHRGRLAGPTTKAITRRAVRAELDQRYPIA